MSGEERFELDPDDAGYPALVQEGYETSPHIYGVGDPEALQGPCISIIGARKATPYGLEVAHMAGRVSAEAGLCIVSGGRLAAMPRQARERSRQADVRSSSQDVVPTVSTQDLRMISLQQQGKALAVSFRSKGGAKGQSAIRFPSAMS